MNCTGTVVTNDTVRISSTVKVEAGIYSKEIVGDPMVTGDSVSPGMLIVDSTGTPSLMVQVRVCSGSVMVDTMVESVV